MKVYWRKTYHQEGFCEVSEPEDEETQRQQAKDFAAAQEPKELSELEWAWTDFFAEVPKETSEGEYSIEGDDGTKYDDWFDI